MISPADEKKTGEICPKNYILSKEKCFLNQFIRISTGHRPVVKVVKLSRDCNVTNLN